MVELLINKYDNDKQLVVKKHSSLIQSNNITTLQQRKAFNVMIFTARQELKVNPETRIFTIDLHFLRKLAGIKDTNLKNVKEALKTMQDLKIEYNILGKDKETRESIVLLPMVRIETNQNNSLLSFEFPTDILERIKNPKMYANLDLLIVRDLNSKYSLALYEILKDYANLWVLKININDLKKALWVENIRGYKVFSDFNRRVLKPAVKEINEKTDIQASYKGIKRGVEYIQVEFTIKIKSNQQALTFDTVSFELQQLGFTETEIHNIKNQYEESYILENIQIIKQDFQNGKIQNIKGYTITALNKDFRKNKTQYEIQQEEIKQQQKEEAERLERERQQQEEKERQEAIQKQEELERKLKEKGEDYIKQMQELFIKDLQENNKQFVLQQVKKYWIENPMIKWLFMDFVSKYL